MNVIANIAVKIANWCCPRAEAAEHEAICYGIELMIETVYKNGAALLLGLITGYFNETLIILVIFKLLRIQAGGGHAATGLRCTIYTVAVAILGAVFHEYWILSKPALFVVYGCCIAVLWLWAPSATLNNPIVHPAIIRRKKVCALLMTGGGLLLIWSGIPGRYSGLITYSIVIEVISVAMNEIKKRRTLK